MQFVVPMRVTFNGTALVEADSEEEARTKAGAGDFDFEQPAAEMVDWNIQGRIQRCD